MILINHHIDTLINIFDSECRKLDLTNGEMIVLLTALYAGALKEAGTREIISPAIGFILTHVTEKTAPEQAVYWNELLRVCRVEESSR